MKSVINRRLMRSRSHAFIALFNFIEVPARRRPGTSLTLPTISPLAVPVGTGFRRWQFPGAAGGNTPPGGRRRPAEVRLLPCQARPPPDRGQQNAAGASHDAGTAGRDAAGSVACAGAAFSSSGRAGPAGAICAGGGTCWGGGGVGGGTGTLAGTAREASAGPGSG